MCQLVSQQDDLPIIMAAKNLHNFALTQMTFKKQLRNWQLERVFPSSGYDDDETIHWRQLARN